MAIYSISISPVEEQPDASVTVSTETNGSHEPIYNGVLQNLPELQTTLQQFIEIGLKQSQIEPPVDEQTLEYILMAAHLRLNSNNYQLEISVRDELFQPIN